MSYGHLESSAAPADVTPRHKVAVPRQSKLLGTPTICERFGISRHTWHRWVVSGQAPQPIRGIPGHPRWALADIETFERGRSGRR